MSELHVYRFLRDSFNAQLEAYHLLYCYELPLQTTVSDLIKRVAADMQSSAFEYEFSAMLDDPESYLPHERLPLVLLKLVNRGVPRTQDGLIRLIGEAHGDLTIEDLAADNLRFAAPVAIEGTRLVIHFGSYLFYPLPFSHYN